MLVQASHLYFALSMMNITCGA
uniref:Uncharacterized protein n=1 Tax=Arundo donax TaxID=35708 RepID=A0A0A9B3X6_ARUDO